MNQSKYNIKDRINNYRNCIRPFVVSVFFYFTMLLTSTVFAQSENVQQISPIRDGLRENYTNTDYENFLKQGNNKKNSDPAEYVYSVATADVLVNNNNGSVGTGNFTQSETSILAFGTNVLIGFNDSGSYTGGASKFTGFSYSTDGGTTFIDGGTLPTNAGGDAGDPVLARNEITGRIYFATLGFQVTTIQVFRSDNNGLTWMAPVNGTPAGDSEDKQWIAVDNYSGTGNGNVYLISRRFGGPQGIYLFHSIDNGNTFIPSGGVNIYSGGQGAFVAVGPDHSVYAFYYDGTSTIQMRKSTDYGVTFSAAITVVSGLTGGTNGDLSLVGIRQGTSTATSFRSNEFPHVAINPVSGHLYCTFDDDPAGSDKANIYMVASTNGGSTWSVRTQINDDVTTKDQWMPTIAVNPAGDKLGIFYYSRQEDAANNLFKYYGRLGNISGSVISFEPSFAISEVASLPEFGRDNVVNSVYMGDYNQAFATSSDFHVIWSDNRDDLPSGSPRKDPNVYYEKIPIGPPCPITTSTNPNPVNGTTGLPLSGNILSWTNGTGATQVEVWFGASGNINKVYDGSIINSFSLIGLEPLNYNAIYQWKVVGKNGTCSISSPTWSFTTMQDPNLIEFCEPFNDLSNWTIVGPLGLTNWSANSSSNAGGTPPELRFSWTPEFTGMSLIRSSAIPLLNNLQTSYSFNFFLDWYADPSGVITVSVTYDGGATESILWQQTNPTGNIGPITVSGNFTTPSSGANNAQIQIWYNGYTFNIDYIYWDDLCISQIVPVTTFQLSVNVANGWNMVSIPGLHPTDQNVNTWWQYRDMGANVFKYLSGYQSVTDAVPGIGYWMKHLGARTYNTGDEWPGGGIQIVAHSPLAGAIGWNLIGGYELSVTAANVTTIPSGLQSGPIYKYSGGYQVATTIDPGYGYWIKLTGAGQIIIPETFAKESQPVEYFPENWGKIVITDATGINYTLYSVKGQVDLSQYELPPAPMEGMFDIRFSSGRIAEDINSSMKTIDMSGVTYPITVRSEGMDMRMMDETGKTVNVNLKSGEEVVISDATIQKLMVTSELIPAVYALEQNYPNPFNPSTVIEFSLPEDVSNVKLSIYNALGEKVAELVNTALAAGKYSYQWNAKNVATGLYIYELRTDKFVSVKKMLLLK